MNNLRLNEALGVPQNIVETAKNVYSRILNWTRRIDVDDLTSGQGATADLRVNFNISDYHFSTLRVKLGVDEHPNVVEPEIISMAVRTQSKKTEDFKLENIKSKTVDLVIVMVVPEGFDYNDIPKFMEENKNEIITSLSHELKHVYDNFKQKFQNPQERAIYQASTNFGFNFEPLDRFLHDMYFTSANENLVRPSEISAAIQTGEISQKDFINFLRSNDTYRNLRRIADFSVENFKKEILKDQKGLNKLLKKVKLKPKEMTDEEKVEAAIKVLYSTTVNARIENYQNILTSHFLETLLGFQGEKRKVFEKFANRNARFQNDPEGFIRAYEKYFKFIGEKMIKKISKLYDITRK